jgi:hypothetical protein
MKSSVHCASSDVVDIRTSAAHMPTSEQLFPMHNFANRMLGLS